MLDKTSKLLEQNQPFECVAEVEVVETPVGVVDAPHLLKRAALGLSDPQSGSQVGRARCALLSAAVLLVTPALLTDRGGKVVLPPTPTQLQLALC